MSAERGVIQAEVKKISRKPGVYALCNLDEMPLYVGQGTSSKSGIQQRVRRHITSARSDIIANRVVALEEIAYVWTWELDDSPVATADQLESDVYRKLSEDYTLLNVKPPSTKPSGKNPVISQELRVITRGELCRRKDPQERLIRLTNHLHELTRHTVQFKNTKQQRRALKKNIERAFHLMNRLVR